MTKYLVGTSAGFYIPNTNPGEVAWYLVGFEDAAEFASRADAEAALQAFFVTNDAKADLHIIEVRA